jgi:ABC-2 type transport system permease protein
VTTGLEAAFEKWGIKVAPEMVLDTKNDSFPIPKNRDLGNGMMVRELHQVAYPMFVKLDGDQLASSSLITGGLTGSVVHWGSPVTAQAKVGDDQHRVEELLRTTKNAWLTTSTEAQPNLDKYPGLGFEKPAADKLASHVLAVAVSGGFASSLPEPPKTAPDPKQPPPARRIPHSPPDTRIVVFGSSAFASDDILGLAQQLDSQFAAANVELVHNAVDWALADTELLQIRSRSAGARALTIEPDAREGWRTANIAIAFAGLVLVIGLAYLRRRSVRPVTGEEASS